MTDLERVSFDAAAPLYARVLATQGNYDVSWIPYWLRVNTTFHGVCRGASDCARMLIEHAAADHDPAVDGATVSQWRSRIAAAALDYARAVGVKGFAARADIGVTLLAAHAAAHHAADRIAAADGHDSPLALDVRHLVMHLWNADGRTLKPGRESARVAQTVTRGWAGRGTIPAPIKALTIAATASTHPRETKYPVAIHHLLRGSYDRRHTIYTALTTVAGYRRAPL